MAIERTQSTRALLIKARAEQSGITYSFNVSGLSFPFERATSVTIDPAAVASPEDTVVVFNESGCHVADLERVGSEDIIVRRYDRKSLRNPELLSIPVPCECYKVTYLAYGEPVAMVA